MPTTTNQKIGSSPSEAQIRVWRAAFKSVAVAAITEALNWQQPQQPQQPQKASA